MEPIKPPREEETPVNESPMNTNNDNDKTMNMLCHLLALSGFFVPLGSVIGPLIIWLVKKDEIESVDRHGRAALNFQLTMLIVYVVCFILLFVAIGAILLPIAALFSFIMIIVASIKAYEGKEVSYPFSIKFL